MKPSILTRLREHPDSPRWNHSAADRLLPEDLEALDVFREALRRGRSARKPGQPPRLVRAKVAGLRTAVPVFRKNIPAGLDIERDWLAVATTSREDIALRPESLVPDDAVLSGMIVYRTAGTTGHALLVPHAPRAAASYLPLLEVALSRHGARPRFGPREAACFLVGAQASTVTYATTLSAWRGGGFAKLNLRAGEWPAPDSPRRYFADLGPRLLTGDPISFAEMLKRGVEAEPAALVTTAVAMSPALRRRLARAYGCPVIDWYSLTETGPLGYGCPRGGAYHLLPHDVHIEALDGRGEPVGGGRRGEITVTGGRNPYLPLLRYRTGDWGRLEYAPCPCGDPMPRLLDLEGRAPVLFRALDGSVVNAVDISRVLREFPFVQHEFRQRKDLSCELTIRPMPGARLPGAGRLSAALKGLFGEGLRLDVTADPELGDRRAPGKATAYRSDLLLED